MGKEIGLLSGLMFGIGAGISMALISYGVAYLKTDSVGLSLPVRRTGLPQPTRYMRGQILRHPQARAYETPSGANLIRID